MFCNEPILKVFELQYRDDLLENWQDAYLHTTGEFEYHVTEGYWMLFETENHYITIGYDGVQKYQKPYVFPEGKFEWWYDGDDGWIDYKDTLLSGQRIHSVEEIDDHKVIYFDSCKLHLYVYEENEFNLSRGSFGNGINTMALGGHLLKKCECGGAGELLLDERGDFAVRCKVCHRATYFDMILKNQIDAWNNGDAPCTIDTGRESVIDLFRCKEIKYLALPSNSSLSQFHQFEMIDNISCDCSHVMIGFEDEYFLLSSIRIGRDTYDFSGMHISDYNREIWTNIIKPIEQFYFVGEEEDFEKRKALHFKLDDIDLLVEATTRGLSVYLDETQLYLNRDNIKRKNLF